MNQYTKNIASLLNITLEEAGRVQDQMERNGVDFSECSTRTFNKEARLAAKEISSLRLTTEQMISILKNGTIKECSEEHKRQVMDFAFGEEFMESEDKGTIKEEFVAIEDSSPLFRVDWVDGYGDVKPQNITLKAIAFSEDWEDLSDSDLDTLKSLNANESYLLQEPTNSVLFTRLI